jgi:hypothetical protein
MEKAVSNQLSAISFSYHEQDESRIASQKQMLGINKDRHITLCS